MKKINFLLIIWFAFNLNVIAQLKVGSTGSVAIANTPTAYDHIKLKVDLSTYSHSSYCNYALAVINTPCDAGRYNYGIYGSSYFSSTQTYSQNYGVYGQAGNATNGYNYGVYGRLIGSYNGAGIFGAMRDRSVYNTGGNYAGYFNGNVVISDNLFVAGTISSSDQRLKKNIATLTSNTFVNLSQLNAVSYLYKTRQELKAEGIIPTDTSTTTEAESIYINKTHYGFIAQDVQQILPELVYEREDGILGIDYIGFIPIIIETIKQQNAKINNLELQLADCCNPSTGNPELKMGSNESNNNSENTETLKTARLYQNSPNPFTTETQIKCFIPDNAKNAQLIIYNMQGTQLRKHPINSTGEINVKINAYEFTAGMYLYALIVDGKEIDVKRMILTD